MKGQSGARPIRTTKKALSDAKNIRAQLIDLSHEIPDDPSRAVLDAWAKADGGLFDLIRALEANC